MGDFDIVQVFDRRVDAVELASRPIYCLKRRALAVQFYKSCVHLIMRRFLNGAMP